LEQIKNVLFDFFLSYQVAFFSTTRYCTVAATVLARVGSS